MQLFEVYKHYMLMMVNIISAVVKNKCKIVYRLSEYLRSSGNSVDGSLKRSSFNN